MYTVRTYRLKNQKDVESELKVDNLNKAKNLADSIFDATTQTVEVIDSDTQSGVVVYVKTTPKNAFDKANQRTRERSLMKTAMRIMDLYGEMSYSHHLNPDKLDSVDYMEKLQIFCTWALEYEEQFFDTDEYNFNWLYHTEDIFTAKLKEEFGSEEN